MPALALMHIEDPASVILQNAGDLSEIKVYNQQVLVGLYERPANLKTRGGVIIANETVKDDKHQTKVGLVLKVGPSAFVDAAGVWFRDENGEPDAPGVGDWVVFRLSDGWTLTLQQNGIKQLCRVFDDTSIRMKISDPDMVY
jgi:hypothetical protein